MNANKAAPVIDRAQLESIYHAAVKRYIRVRRARVEGFVDRHFSLQGSIRLHRHSLGWDMLKSPVNALASAATVAKYAGAKALHVAGAANASRRLAERNFFLQTALGTELERLIREDLLELSWGHTPEQPAVSKRRRSKPLAVVACQADALHAETLNGLTHDALMQEICSDPLLANVLAEATQVLAERHGQADFQERLTETLHAYVGSRAAAADISVSLLSMAAGWVAFNKITPGLTALSANLSANLAQALAIHSFWPGPWAGTVYYSMVGVAAPKLMMAGVFAGLLLPASLLATFSGVVTDPVQRKLGLHQKRLQKVVDHVERQLLGDVQHDISFKDHYIARMLDVLDLSQSIVGLAR